MRVTFVLPTVSMVGGIRVVGIYASRLAARGHSVYLVSPPPKPPSLRQKFRSWKNGDGWPTTPIAARSHLDDIGVYHKILAEWRPVVDADVPDADVTIATWWETAEWVDRLSPRKGAKVYFIQHHEIFHYLPIERARATYRLPMHKIVIARWLKDVMARDYRDETVDLVPNSVDRKQFSAPARGKQLRPTIGLLYSSAAFKGYETAVAALNKVQQNLPDLRIICFGSEHPTARSPLPAEAEFWHAPPQEELRNLYASCDVWLTASVSEGFNLPAMEAMACRTPVVATKTGWPEEAIRTGWNGVLVDIGNTSALAGGLEWVLRQTDHDWRLLSANAYATAASSSWELSTDLFERALEHACMRAARKEISGRACRTGPPHEGDNERIC